MNLNNIDISDLQQSLSPEEQEAVLSILKEYSDSGTSDTLQGIWMSDYEEIPVDIKTFITDPEFLGKIFVDDDGNLLIYKFWVDVLSIIFAENSPYFECLSGDTKVKLLDGSSLTMKDINNRLKDSNDLIEIYSYDRDSQEIVPSYIKSSRMTGVKDIYRITLDNGKYIDCTTNHKILMRDGSYKTIDEGLTVGDSLMPFNHRIVSIEYLRTDEVYDIEVPVYHNFCLESGAIVHNCVFSGAIGLGKSTIACVGLAYIIYKLLCLRNPSQYYRLSKKSKIAIAIFNVSLDQGYGVGYYKIQQYCQSSPWFLRHGTLSGRTNLTYYPDKDIEILVGSKMEHFLGRDIFAGFMDEMEFAKGSDPKMEASSVMKLYTTIKRRMESRYMNQGKLPGMLFLVSSKKSEHDFLEQYIKKQEGKPYIFVVDEPIWVVKADLGLYSGKYFKVAVGNRYLKSKILTEEDDPNSYTKNGQEVIDVPIEYREAFDLDINTSLMDIAGKALSSSLKFIYYDKLKLCYREYLKNPFTMNSIELGFDDESELKDFLIPEYLSVLDRAKPRFIHWDASKNGDATGLAMTSIANSKTVRRLVGGQVYSENDIVHKLDFAIRIKAVPGQEIPFYKIRNFIYYLKGTLGYNIISVTCDSFQSVDTLQQLKLRGFLTATLSVDRSRVPYEGLKNAINEGRFICPYIEELEDELLDIEDDKTTGKIDHTETGCLTPDTKIITTNGPKFIKDLVEGQDKILALDDNGNVIESDFCNLRVTKEVEEIFEIETEDGDIIRCTSNHPILTQRGYVRADELKDSDEIISIIDSSDLSNLSNKDKREFFRSSELIDELYKRYFYSTREIAELFNVNFGHIKRALSYKGILRSKSESHKVAMSKHRDKLVSSSRSEEEFENFLKESKIRFIHQYKIEDIDHYYDFYLIDYNLIVEIDGYMHESSYESDLNLSFSAITEGYSIVRIPEILCRKYGDNLYKELFKDSNYKNYLFNSSGSLKSTDFSSLVSQLSEVDRRTYRYGLPSYTGFQLSDHWKYRDDIDYEDMIEFIGKDRDHTLSEICDRYKISRNLLRRFVREFYSDEPEFESFVAKYTCTTEVNWKVRKYISEYIDLGIIEKRDSDIITRNEFLKYEKEVGGFSNLPEVYNYFGRSRNYCKSWFYHIMEVNMSEYFDF